MGCLVCLPVGFRFLGVNRFEETFSSGYKIFLFSVVCLNIRDYMKFDIEVEQSNNGCLVRVRKIFSPKSKISLNLFNPKERRPVGRHAKNNPFDISPRELCQVSFAILSDGQRV